MDEGILPAARGLFQRMDRYRTSSPLDLHDPPWAGGEVRGQLCGRVGGNEDAGTELLVHALQSAGEVHRVADRGVVHSPLLVADEPDHRVAGVDADADLESRPAGGAPPGVELLQP